MDGATHVGMNNDRYPVQLENEPGPMRLAKVGPTMLASAAYSKAPSVI